MESTDRYATARATLRENVKWLSASFAGMTAVVLAGTPFTGFGALAFPSGRFFGALSGLVAATGCAFFALQLLLKMVRPDATYTRYLREHPGDDLSNLNAEDQAEYRELKAEYEVHKQELLPAGRTTLEGLEKLVDDAWQVYQENPTDALAKDRWSAYQANFRAVEDWASYTRLHQRIERGFKSLRGLGLGMLFSLALFAWCSNPDKDKGGTSSKSSVTIEQGIGASAPPDKPRPPSVQLKPVLFDPGKSILTSDGRAAVGGARNYLREDAGTAVLLLAHTDTTGGDETNARLAAARAHVVRDALVGEGGIAPTRVFVTELPKMDLTTLTGPQVPLDLNRTVEFAVVTLPPR